MHSVVKKLLKARKPKAYTNMKLTFPDICEDMRRRNTMFLLAEVISHGRKKDVRITTKFRFALEKEQD
jgi:hypothetical protein